MTDYKLEFAKLLEKAILKDEFDSFRIIALIERPPEKEMGDFSFPTFTLSKTFKKPPITISEELLNQLKQEEGMFTFSSVAGYVNAKVSSEILFSETISEVISKG
ncbi:MAG: arginine--tRNA ligase, partial [archaeon]